ncbi:hypothetical protein DSECCO2_497640 [anaerobic digester metagenome]
MQSLGFPLFLTRGSRAIARIIKTEPAKIMWRYSLAKESAGPFVPSKLMEVLQKINPPAVKTAPAMRHKGKALFIISRASPVFPSPSLRAIRLDEPIPIIIPAAIIAR